MNPDQSLYDLSPPFSTESFIDTRLIILLSCIKNFEFKKLKNSIEAHFDKWLNALEDCQNKTDSENF